LRNKKVRCAVGFGVPSETRWDGRLEAPPYPGENGMVQGHPFLAGSASGCGVHQKADGRDGMRYKKDQSPILNSRVESQKMRCAMGFGIPSETRWDGGLEAPPYPGLDRWGDYDKLDKDFL